MGRDFLLVNHNYFGELSMGRKFQTFFHKPSLSVVEVKVKEHSPVVNSLGTPETHMQDDPLPMVDVSYPPMPSQMQYVFLKELTNSKRHKNYCSSHFAGKFSIKNELIMNEVQHEQHHTFADN